MFCHEPVKGVSEVEIWCQECGKKTKVEVIPALAYGCAGAVCTGFHEAVGCGSDHTDPLLCQECSAIVISPNEIVDRPDGTWVSS